MPSACPEALRGRVTALEVGTVSVIANQRITNICINVCIAAASTIVNESAANWCFISYPPPKQRVLFTLRNADHHSERKEPEISGCMFYRLLTYL